MKKILVIEDDFEIRDCLESIIEDIDYEKVMCATVAASKEFLKTETPSLIICDLLLPDGDSFEIFEWLMKQESKKIPPVIILSAVPQSDYESRAGAYGITEYFSKPFRVKELLASINKFLLLDTEA